MLQDEVRKTPAQYRDILEPSCYFLACLHQPGFFTDSSSSAFVLNDSSERVHLLSVVRSFPI